MRIVIAGAGEVGTHLAKMLSRENHDIIVIDSDIARLEKLAATCDLMTLHGNVTFKQLLMDAGVDKADLFIAVTPYDDTNTLSAIMAKKLGAKLTVVRIGSSEPLSGDCREIYRGLGIDSIVYPEKIVLGEVTNTLGHSGLSTLAAFSDGGLSLLSLKMENHASIVNKTPKEAADIYDIEYRAVAIQRNGKTIIPYGDAHFEADDTVYIMTNRAGIRNIMRHSGQKQEHFSHVMILGGSHIGRLIAKELGKEYHIKIFESDREEAYRLSDTLNNVLVIHGDGTKVDLLLEEGLRTTDAFIAVTGNPETNIWACLLAKNEGVKHTIAEIEDLDYIRLAERLGIDTIINKKMIAAAHIYRYTLANSVSKIKYLTTTDVEALEFVVSPESKIIEHPLRDSDFPKNAIIGGLVRGKQGLIATGDTWIQPNDHVVVFTLPSSINEVSKFFK